jgi:DNA polymerase-3 subunit epsilon
VFAPRICFVDVETTGASPRRERLTEVGVVTVDVDGDRTRVQEWSTLVNPGVPIPPDIQWLTGITNEMVRGAPPFADVAQALFDRLADAVFVAHNVRFDYGFLKSEFARAGVTWRAPTLCTVRLSRLLYPDRAPHSLDAIVARFGLDGEQRHRALGDARVLWRLLQTLYARHPRDELEGAIAALLARPATPAHLPPDALDDLPAAPGVYRFFGLNAHPIYVGKAIDLRERVGGHFGADHANATDARLSQEVRRIEWEETAGETGALLREAEVIRTELPAHNVALRRRANQVLVALDDDARPRFVPALAAPLDRLQEFHGPFGSRAAARRLFVGLASEHGCCLKTLGLERAPRPCFNYQIHRCAGACVGVEPRAAHAERVRALLEPLRLPRWPFDGGPVALVERNPARHREDWHVFDRWCWLGTVKTADAAAALARAAPRVFEPDVYRIVRRALARTGDPALAWQPLGPLAGAGHPPGEPVAGASRPVDAPAADPLAAPV